MFGESLDATVIYMCVCCEAGVLKMPSLSEENKALWRLDYFSAEIIVNPEASSI